MELVYTNKQYFFFFTISFSKYKHILKFVFLFSDLYGIYVKYDKH